MGFKRQVRLLAAALLAAGMLVVFRMPGLFLPPMWLLAPLALVPWLFAVERFSRPARAGCDGERPGSLAPLLVLVAALVLMLFTSAVRHKWFFFLRWAPDTHQVPWVPHRMALLVLYTALLAPLFALGRRRLPGLMPAVLLLSQVACFHALMRASGGHALSRDDHPSMMFRLWEISRTWPQLVNYNPYWNAGTVDFAGAASGLNGLGMLVAPFLHWCRIQDIYTPMIGAAFIFLIPWMAALSVRVAGGRGAALWTAGILGLGVSQHFFLWLLQYGTVGACFSSAFILPFAAGVFRVLWMGRREWWLLVLVSGSFVFLMMWPPGALMAAAVFVAAVASARRWTWKRVGFLALCGAVGLALHYRTFGAIFLQGGEQLLNGDLAAAPRAAAGGGALRPLAHTGAMAASGWSRLISHLHEVNPILVVMGIAGTLVFPLRSVRRWFAPIIITLAILCGWGPELLPHLELGRMSIPLAYVAIAPAALGIERILRSGRFMLTPARAVLVALLILTGWNARGLFGGRQALFTVTYMGEKTESLVALVKAHAEPGSRVLFAGPCVHAYGDGGHVALLPYLGGREMMACDYYHFPMAEVEYEYPPPPFRDKPDLLYAFLADHNVSLVFARRTALYKGAQAWAPRLEKEPARYRRIGGLEHGQVAVFRVEGYERTMFLKGSGTVEADFNRIRVRTGQPGERTVIKYRWQEGLRVAPPVEIRPFRVAEGIDMVEIVWNGRAECAIRYASAW